MRVRRGSPGLLASFSDRHILSAWSSQSCAIVALSMLTISSGTRTLPREESGDQYRNRRERGRCR